MVAPGVASVIFKYSRRSTGPWKRLGAPDTTAPYRVHWNDTKLRAGHYHLRVTTVDKAGNSFIGAVIMVVVPKRLAFSIGSAKVIPRGATSYITDTMKPNAKVKISVTLFLGKRVVKRWHLKMKPGIHTASLAIATSKLKVGTYTLSAKATSADTQSLRRTTSFRILPKPRPTF